MPQQSSVSARSEPLKYRISSECEENNRKTTRCTETEIFHGEHGVVFCFFQGKKGGVEVVLAANGPRERSSPEGGYGKEKGARRKAAMEKRPELAGRRLWKRERSTPEGGYGKQKGARR